MNLLAELQIMIFKFGGTWTFLPGDNGLCKFRQQTVVMTGQRDITIRNII